MAKREDKPFSIRLNELKGPLQMWAQEDDRSTNYIILKILEDAVIKKFNYKPGHFNKPGRAQRRAAR